MTKYHFSACIIATAAYESPFALEVQYLRTVRDFKMRSTPIGNRLMDSFEAFYYSFSPRVAYCMVQNKNLKSIMRLIIVRPFISLVKLITNLFMRNKE